jgi:3-isopropylmalate/(R)-2-methylmalate dehydratase small subunit
MERFSTLEGIAAALPMINVDTDQIIPARYLTTIKRTGLGKGLFDSLRYDASGNEKPDFVLNRAPYRGAKILIAGENFGCGSSREHAPWALLDFGIRCVIAPSFADIFFNNCGKNGILLITLDEAEIDRLMAEAADPARARMTIDLVKQTIARDNRVLLSFEIDPARKARLLNGLDDVGMTLQNVTAIDAFEARQRLEQPWLYR